MESNQNLIGSKRWVLGQNQNTNLQVNLTSRNRPLIEYDRIDILNLQQLFNEEREKSKKYRINGTINLYVSATLATGSTVYVDGKYDGYAWDPLLYGSPPITPSNWVMQITYPSNSDYNFLINSRTTNGTISSLVYRGLQYQKLSFVLNNGNNYLTVLGIQKHKLQVGDFIYLYSNSVFNPLQGFYKIRELGINGENQEVDFTLDTIINPTTIPFGFGNFVRVVDTSQEDFTFSSSSDFLRATATDVSGNTLGNYGLNEERYTMIETSSPHNLIKNNYVEIRTFASQPLSSLNGIWLVENIVTTNTTSASTKFIIRHNLQLPKGSIQNYSSPYPKWRLVDGTPSEYYVRKFELLTTNNYEVYRTTKFSSNIYPDTSDKGIGLSNDTWGFQFNKDIDIERLRDNRNGSISKLYYTIIKRAGQKPYNWENVTADWDFNYKTTNVTNGLEYISIVRPNAIGTIEKFSARTETLDNNGLIVTTDGDKYIGDLTEFNRLELKEITISEVIHRFGDVGGVESYYYKPFNELPIRRYSNNIETAESIDNIINVPTNYVTYSDNSIAWRDLLSIGFFEEGTNGVNYPFINNTHYLYFNYNLYVRRQFPLPENIINPRDGNFINKTNLEC